MDIGVVVAAQTLLLLTRPLSQGLTDVTVRILAANHESDLTRRVGRDGGVGVFGDGEDFLASLAQVCDEREVQPLVFG